MTTPTRPPLPFNPTNWYWIVAGSTTQVYSSASDDYVPVADATYQAWLAKGGNPTKIPSEADLGEVLAQYSQRPLPAGVLDGYTSAQARNITVQFLAKVLFWIVNQILVLKGQQQMTAAQMFTFFKSLM